MKSKLTLLLIVGLGLSTWTLQAGVKDAVITWTGDAGYHAEINLSCDDTFPLIGASGGWPYPYSAPTNQGILQLSVAFFDPLSQPLFSAVNISNSIVTYKFLALTLDTASGTLIGPFDVGKDSFAEGEPGSSMGEYFLAGTSLHDSFLAQVIDSGGQLHVTIVPEPSILSFCFCTAAIIAFKKRS